jgi:zinc and cadmium transporter
MPSQTPEILLAVTIVGLLSVVGASVLLTRKGLKGWLPLLVALSAGALIGDTFLHLLPDAVAEHGGFGPPVAWGVLGGIIGFFLIENVLHWHHHGEDVHLHAPGGVHSIGWMNLLGDVLHNVVDGMLIAAAWLVDPQAGIATTIAVALHEIPQEFGDFGVLLHAGMSPRKAILFNLLCGLTAILGALVVLFTHGQIGIAPYLVPVAAGGFIYVACADLVPAVRDRARRWELVSVSLALLAGLGLMTAVHAVHVCGHDHDHGHGHGHGAQPAKHAPHDGHEGHDHDDHEGHEHD